MNTVPTEVRRKQLRFRASRRGFKEADAIFGALVALHLDAMDMAELDALEALLAAPDHELYDWLRGSAPAPASHETPVLARLRAICNRKHPIWNV